jgi:hypothetical protein
MCTECERLQSEAVRLFAECNAGAALLQSLNMPVQVEHYVQGGSSWCSRLDSTLSAWNSKSIDGFIRKDGRGLNTRSSALENRDLARRANGAVGPELVKGQ